MIPRNLINRLRKNLSRLDLLIRIPDPDYQRQAIELLGCIRRQAMIISLLNEGKLAPQTPDQAEADD